MVETLTSYDAASSGNVVNEVLFEYDDAGLLSKEYQEHAGAKDASTLYVQYNRDETAADGVFTKGLRPTSVRYPNGRLVHTTYGTPAAWPTCSTVSPRSTTTTRGSPGDPLAEYEYLGSGTIVSEDYPEPDVKLDYIGDGTYAGFDRFGRVVDQRWYDYGASADRDRYTYGYDRASNRLYRENTTTSGKDEFYTYDGVNRLVAFDRGDLNASKTAISGTPVREEDWTLDPTGQLARLRAKDLRHDRPRPGPHHNEVNEITAITATTGTNWADPAYDRAGNMTTIPKPAEPGQRPDRHLRRLEPPGRSRTTAKPSSPNTTTTASTAASRRAYDTDRPGQPDRHRHLRPLLLQQRLANPRNPRNDRESRPQPRDLQPLATNTSGRLRYIDAPILRDENTDQDGLCDDAASLLPRRRQLQRHRARRHRRRRRRTLPLRPLRPVTIYDGTWTNTRSTSSLRQHHPLHRPRVRPRDRPLPLPQPLPPSTGRVHFQRSAWCLGRQCTPVLLCKQLSCHVCGPARLADHECGLALGSRKEAETPIPLANCLC